MLDELKHIVCSSNLELVRRGVVIYTWGNVSGVDRKSGCFVIKPSGVPYDGMLPEDMVVVDIESGQVVEGRWHPSTDTPTHLELYRSFSEIGGITHTHSPHAVAFAQARRCIPALGTTHADYFHGSVPCTRGLTEAEVAEGYEKNTGKVIVEAFADDDYMAVPGILVGGHGPFAWGKNAEDSVCNAVVLEVIASMALETIVLNPNVVLEQYVLNKHYSRKHGKGAYYGQAIPREQN